MTDKGGGMLVSVCIPVYNMESTIEMCIRSALAQTYPFLEILVTDNQSTDRTYELARSIGDERLRVVRNEKNLGAYGNHNRCLELAKGEWVKFLHGDDELLPNCVEEFAAAVRRCPPDTGLVGCGAIQCDQSGRQDERTRVPSRIVVMNSAPPSEFVLEGNFFGTPTMVLVHRERLLSIGGFDLSMEPAADGDCWIALRKHFPSAYLPLHLVVIRDDPPGTVAQRIRHLMRGCKDTIRGIEKWHRLDERAASPPLADTLYGEWVCREMFRFWDAALLYMIRGEKGIFDALWAELGRIGMRGRSLKYYVIKRGIGKNSLSLRGTPWEIKLSALRMPFSEL